MLEKLEKLEIFNQHDSSKTFIKTDEQRELKSTVCTICTQEPALPCLLDKLTDIAIENKEAGLILSTAIAASIIIYAVSKSVAEIIVAWRK